jgi:hypothetical protein
VADQAIAIDSNAAAVAVQYQQASKLVAKSVVKVLRTIGAGVIGYVGREKLSGQLLEARTGTLRRALFYKVFTDANGLDAGVIVGADVKKAPHAAVHEYGATIRPVKAKKLAIPLDAAKTTGGVARMSAREFMEHPESLGFERAFINPKGTAIMGVRNTGSAGFDDDSDLALEPVFALKDAVTIPERSYLRAGVNERRVWILQQLGASVAGVNDGLNR